MQILDSSLLFSLPTESIPSASAAQQPLDLKKAGTKRSRGNVPEYFTAASLAESPFKSTKWNWKCESNGAYHTHAFV